MKKLVLPSWVSEVIHSPKPVAVAARRRSGAGGHGLVGRRKRRADRRQNKRDCVLQIREP